MNGDDELKKPAKITPSLKDLLEDEKLVHASQDAQLASMVPLQKWLFYWQLGAKTILIVVLSVLLMLDVSFFHDFIEKSLQPDFVNAMNVSLLKVILIGLAISISALVGALVSLVGSWAIKSSGNKNKNDE